MYHLIKYSREYNGISYCGPASDNKPTECFTLEQAVEVGKKLLERNNVGWVVYNAVTKQRLCMILQD